MNERSARPGLRERLLEKLPEILIEAASVVIALLLALALNQWNENRETRTRADAARAAILGELRANREEIGEQIPKLKAIVSTLSATASGSTPPPSREMQVNLGVALLSAAAWHAALATQASQTIDFAWMTRVAKVYELQDNYVRVQNLAIDQLSSIPAEDKNLTGQEIARSLVARMSALSQIADGLARNYDEVLDASGTHP
jgi:hypothetical protein